MTNLVRSTLAVLVLASPSLALAHQAGDIIIRGGALKMEPEKKSSHSVGSLSGKLPWRAQSNSDTQLGLNFTYMFSDYLGVDLLTSTPFTHKLDLKHDLGNKGKLGKTKHLPATFSLVYFPFGNSEVIQPYLGAGLNYSAFYDSSLSQVAKSAGYSNFKLKNAWGFSGQLGMDVDLGDNFVFNAQARYTKMDTKITMRDNSYFGEKEKMKWNMDPLTYMIGVGYKF